MSHRFAYNRPGYYYRNPSGYSRNPRILNRPPKEHPKLSSIYNQTFIRDSVGNPLDFSVEVLSSALQAKDPSSVILSTSDVDKSIQIFNDSFEPNAYASSGADPFDIAKFYVEFGDYKFDIDPNYLGSNLNSMTSLLTRYQNDPSSVFNNLYFQFDYVPTTHLFRGRLICFICYSDSVGYFDPAYDTRSRPSTPGITENLPVIDLNLDLPYCYNISSIALTAYSNYVSFDDESATYNRTLLANRLFYFATISSKSDYYTYLPKTGTMAFNGEYGDMYYLVQGDRNYHRVSASAYIVASSIINIPIY